MKSPAFTPPRFFLNLFSSNLADNLKQPDWAVITATVEADGAYDSPANKINHARLLAELEEAGIHRIACTGFYQGVNQGPSYVIYADRMTALSLARRHKQECILTCDGLIYMDGSCHAANHDDDVFAGEARAQDCYTELPNGLCFSIGLDFSKKFQLMAVYEKVAKLRKVTIKRKVLP